jgi:hypothetical protein
MSEPAGEQWSFTIMVQPGSVPAAQRVKRWLKLGLRALGLRAFGLRCVRLDEPEEVKRLRALVQSLADRCEGQSELLTARAEGRRDSA